MKSFEELGHGTSRMIRLTRERDLPPPVFQETADGFSVTLCGYEESLFTGEVDVSPWAYPELERAPGAGPDLSAGSSAHH